MVQSTLDPVGIHEVLQGSGHVVGGLHTRVADKWQIYIPRELYTKPDIAHIVADRTALPEGHLVYLISLGGQHNL